MDKVMKLFGPALAVFGMTLLVMAGLFMLPVMLLFGDSAPNYLVFMTCALLSLALGLLLVFTHRHAVQHITPRKVFLITAVNWLGVSMIAAIPYILGTVHLGLTDAVFESVSGITTTGSTVLSGLDTMPHDILLWRSITQWLGGIGIVAMAVTILPFLRVGGMRLFKSESSGWSDKATPRVRDQLRYLIMVYLLLTVCCILWYWLAGMNMFDALNHAMTTISTGGFSTYDASLGHFDSLPILVGALIFMILGGIPFTYIAHMLISRRVSFNEDAQIGVYLALILISGLAMGGYLYTRGEHDVVHALVHGFVNTTSVMTTTGFASDDYSGWGGPVVVFFFFLTFIGGCSGSTAGGIKIFRFQLFWLYMKEQIIHSIHPSAVVSLRYNNRLVTEDILSSSISFMYMSMWSYALLSLVLSLCGLDLVTSITGALTALMNVGPGLGDFIGPAGNFQALPEPAKWALSFGMLLGRLEYMTLYVLFIPRFWRD